jgi:hypothetical protein
MTNTKANTPIVSLQTTKDYGQFVMHSHNRVLKDSITGKPIVRSDLVKSMKSEGYRPEEPITAYSNDDGTYTIIDGHNRLIAAQFLGLSVWFAAYQKNGKTEWTPMKSSANRRQWTGTDICRAYAHDGNPHYAELLDYMSRTGIKLMEASSILYGQSANSGNASRFVREGSFVVKNRMNGELVADIVTTAGRFITWSTDRRFVAAISVLLFVPGFSPNQLKEKIIKHHEFLEKRKDRDGMIEMIDSLYNRHSKIRMDLCAESKKILALRSASRNRT